MPETNWNEATITCRCGSTNIKYIEDRDYGDYDVEVYQCKDCGNIIKFELPD